MRTEFDVNIFILCCIENTIFMFIWEHSCYGNSWCLYLDMLSV